MNANEEAKGEAKSEQRADTGRRSRCRDVFLFSHPRTASNLLCRLLSDQPGWIQSEYHFQDAFKFARKSFNWGPITDITHEQRQEFEHLLQRGFNKLQQVREAATTEGKCVFVKNHTFHLWEPSSLSQGIWGGTLAPPFTTLPDQDTGSSASITRTNPTFLPDDFLTSWLPIFLIRHPALVFESWYRAESRAGSVDLLDKSWAYITTFRYSRELYDWFVANDPNFMCREEKSAGIKHPSKPIVIDADDIIEEGSLNKLCELCNMHAPFIRYEWEVTRPLEDGRHSPRCLSYMSGLWSSTSIDKSKTSRGINMATKYNQWKEEFGTAVADALHTLVENAMLDYSYLKSKQI